MSWLRIDDKFARHPKVASLSDREFRTHIETLCYCAEYQNEGKITKGAFRAISGLNERVAKRFVALGIWDENENGREVHDWRIYNAETVEDRVVAYLESHPGASANEVARTVGGKRAIVLALHSALTAPSSDTPEVPDQYPGGTPPVLPAGSPAGTNARAAPSPALTGSKTATAVVNGSSPLAVDVELEQKLTRIGFSTAQIIEAYERPLEELAAWITASEAPGVRNQGAWLWDRLSSGAPPPGFAPATPMFRCDKCPGGQDFKSLDRLTEHLDVVHGIAA